MEYSCRIYASRESCKGREFAVKFIDAGSFPSSPDDKKIHAVVNKNNFAIVAATDRFEDAWSYVNLNGNEKDCIGERMEEFKCEQDIWYWCELFTF